MPDGHLWQMQDSCMPSVESQQSVNEHNIFLLVMVVHAHKSPDEHFVMENLYFKRLKRAHGLKGNPRLC